MYYSWQNKKDQNNILHIEVMSVIVYSKPIGTVSSVLNSPPLPVKSFLNVPPQLSLLSKVHKYSLSIWGSVSASVVVVDLAVVVSKLE